MQLFSSIHSESTPQSLNEKDTVKSFKDQTCSSPTKGILYCFGFFWELLSTSILVVFLFRSQVCVYSGDRIIVDSSNCMAAFSVQVKKI